MGAAFPWAASGGDMVIGIGPPQIPDTRRPPEFFQQSFCRKKLVRFSGRLVRKCQSVCERGLPV